MIPKLTQKVAGIPAWSYGAIATLVVLGVAAFKHQPSTQGEASQQIAAPPYLLVQTPQDTTPYALPVTRHGSYLSSSLPVAPRSEAHKGIRQ